MTHVYPLHQPFTYSYTHHILLKSVVELRLPDLVIRIQWVISWALYSWCVYPPPSSTDNRSECGEQKETFQCFNGRWVHNLSIQDNGVLVITTRICHTPHTSTHTGYWGNGGGDFIVGIGHHLKLSEICTQVDSRHGPRRRGKFPKFLVLDTKTCFLSSTSYLWQGESLWP